ncbi:MAG: class I SAM-dependent methyltransferase [Actinomycetota bacterium]|nr:class I SAM-dependent methyltransferase [Actinomycetota bacterium]
MNRHQFLARLHQLTRPRTYLEIGIESGYSIALTRVPSIGIDPDFNIVAEIKADVHLARTTSDEFFARKDPLAHLPVPVLDLSFIDGMHLAEYVLRDYLAVERFTTPASVVVFDDMLPRSVDEAARRRHTKYWTGDVFKALDALREQRPDLVVIEVATTGSGTAMVLFPDAGQNGVLPGYDEWVTGALSEDPQEVPQALLDRSRAVDPEWLLGFPGWQKLPGLRRGRGQTGVAGQAAVRQVFADLVAQLP